MTILDSIWKNVSFSVGKVAENAASSVSWSYSHTPARDITFRNNRAYKSVLTHVAKQYAASKIEGELNKLFPKYQRYLEKNLRKHVLKQQKENQIELIRKREKVVHVYGKITAEGGHTIIAKDKYGNAVKESLMIYYDGDEYITVEDVDRCDGGEQIKQSFTTKTVCFIDLNPDVSLQSSKNIVQTTVQGRDYSRKELVSGGDLNFTVQGEIVSNEVGIYPANDVKKFIQIMQYGGIVKVNHFVFDQFNVKEVLIKDFNMGNQEYLNIQPYTFTCVAVEPDEDVIVKTDTIAIVNKEIEVSPMNKWYKLILQNKYAEIVANTTAKAVSSAINGGLDALTKNI